VAATKNNTALQQQVMKTLLYFDIFSYPLTAAEVFNFLPVNADSESEVAGCLNDLVVKKVIFRFGHFYSVPNCEKNISRRKKGNEAAQQWLLIATKKAAFISNFPFVRGVMASGSLSKGYMDEKSDLDFFVVTAANRLWIARTLLVLYKRIFLFNSHKQFCVNYFVDVRHLEIEEKNVFTATELITLIPLQNQECYRSLLAANTWVEDFLPNYESRETKESTRASYGFRKFLEFLLHPVSEILDKLCMYITVRRWDKLYGEKYERQDFDIAFKSRRHVSKNHPNHYQKKVLDLYQSRLLQYEKRFVETIAHE
jgi:hypothetical protein